MDYTKCESASDFDTKFRILVAKLDVVEHEETWQQLDDALKGLVSLVKAGATKFDTFVPSIKQAAKYINSAVISERTRLSGTALSLVEEMARNLELRFSLLSDLLFPSVMKICGRANKVFVTRGVKYPRICDAASTDANKTVRSSAAKFLMAIISCCTVPELTPHLAIVEKAIATGVVDANPDARTTARQSYEIYIKRFSTRVEAFHAGLSSTAKKYLKIDDGAAGGRPQSQFAAFKQQRVPLRERIMAQRPNANPVVGAAPDAQVSASGPVRPKPVRPITRQAPTAVRRDGTSTPAPLSIVDPTVIALESASESTADSILTPVAAATVAASAPPTMGMRNPSLENILLSPKGSEPAMARLLNEEPAAAAAAPAEQLLPVDSAHASVSPVVTVPGSRIASPVATVASIAGADTASTSKSATPPAVAEKTAESADEQTLAEDPKIIEAKPKSTTRAQRGTGLKFSSLNAPTTSVRSTRAQHAVRPQSRNLVSSRMEEALRAQRPAKAAAPAGVIAAETNVDANADAEQPRRMTLRSDNIASTTAAVAASASAAPGYLRATASSAKRVSGEYTE
ncbi:clasp N terminal-domain-containing protein [Kickxella alabastrina]|uniref:clasp N terminal-domain-containing protein n=1 Tax=Kickxella alabastrina TaxID=61397 RepID=UPI002220E512|nr:clasp N terminal-domain-containing protein [Kickxella alabastrina]KAI7831999.1 clasp N terminal-domain-containing protein [Kickxella alabastrina]